MLHLGAPVARREIAQDRDITVGPSREVGVASAGPGVSRFLGIDGGLDRGDLTREECIEDGR